MSFLARLTGDASISGHMTPSFAGWILTPCTGGRATEAEEADGGWGVEPD